MDIVLDSRRLLPSLQVALRNREDEMVLLESARAMNRDALVEIFDSYSPALYSYACRLCNDTLIADYVVGDVFAKLLEQFALGRGPTVNLRSYLYEMTYHVIVDRARDAHHQVPLEMAEMLPQEGYSAFVNLENRLLLDTIMSAIMNDLSAIQRDVIILRFLEGFNLRETAAIVKQEVNYVKVIQNRAIATLRKILDHKVTE